jgi:phosphatidylserine/phosphatidylglycerophosphate/cardiolipin synthase-like enzyme
MSMTLLLSQHFTIPNTGVKKAISEVLLARLSIVFYLKNIPFPRTFQLTEDTVLRKIFAVIFLSLFLPASLALAQATIIAVYFPSSVAAGGGTGTVGYPYAVYVRIQNWSAAASSQAYVKIYFNTNNEYMWSATGVWSNTTTYSNTNQPTVSIDAGGNWSGWIFAKHNNTLGVTPRVRAAKVGATATNLTGAAITIEALDMTGAGNGGWIVRNSSPALNKNILAYSGGSVVGSYRTEDNSITEGYSYGAGGFKIAVPVGFVDSLVTVNDDGSRDQSFVGPWPISAGQETDASTSGGGVGKGTATLSPVQIGGGISQTITHILRGESPYTITNAKIVVSPSWAWSHSSLDISLTVSGAPALSISGDTVIVSALTLSGSDSMQLRIGNITPPDTTTPFMFRTLTGTSPDSINPIAVQPNVFVYSIPRPIAIVKHNDGNGVPLRNNQLVTVRGIVTVANEFASPSYIQDLTGGLAVYASAFSSTVSSGDEVVVSGLVQPFNGLTEIVTPSYFKVVSTGNSVQALVVTASQIAGDGVGGVEQYEGLLVRLNGVTVSGASAWTGETNYPLVDASGSTELRIDGSTNLVGQPVPGSAFDVVGVVGQFIGTSPYIGGYQLMPRSTADVIVTGPIFAVAPVESLITSTGMTIFWKTVNPGTTHLLYGTTPGFELGSAGDTLTQTDHSVALTGLTPSTVYYIRAYSNAGADTSFAPTLITSTASPSQTTGTINVYFNKSIFPGVAVSEVALGNQDLVTRIIGRINNTRRSIDAALYSLSGSQGDAIAQALINAKSRGIRVRVICEHDNRLSNAFSALTANGIPLIDDAYDPINAGVGLMHNKFVIFDGRGGAPDSVWVWTGSWNPTQPGTVDDYQNVVEVQDQALAGAYTLEFNEMWGSSGDSPNASLSRFGARKIDNTPHRFMIGGRFVQSYFSPSDRTTSYIVSAINGAQHSVAFALLTFTRNDLGTAVVGRKVAGLKIRGVLDNNVDTGTEYPYLVSNGIDVMLKSGSGLLHHKYAVIDAEGAAWNPVTITGSHNWSSSAENANNENTLIIRDGRVANLYLQEFAARYYQFGGTDSIFTVGVNDDPARHPLTYQLEQNYPNPFNPNTEIGFQVPSAGVTALRVYDVLGREVATLVNETRAAGSYRVRWNADGFASGVYFYRLEAGKFIQTRKMILLK